MPLKGTDPIAREVRYIEALRHLDRLARAVQPFGGPQSETTLAALACVGLMHPQEALAATLAAYESSRTFDLVQEVLYDNGSEPVEPIVRGLAV